MGRIPTMASGKGEWVMSGTSAAGAGVAAALAIAVLFGCAATNPAEGTWGEGGYGKPQLILAGNGTLTGTDGCNRLTGTWTEKQGTVTFVDVASTAMYCEDVDAWLSTLSTATIGNSKMTVSDSSGTEIGTLTKGP